MRNLIIAACCALLLGGCRRQLVLLQSDANWYPGTARNYAGPPSVQVRLVNGHGRPLAAHNLHVDEVEVNTTKGVVSKTLLSWVTAQRNAQGGITLITDERGAVRLLFETPASFTKSDLGMHWLRFSHSKRHGPFKTGKGTACIVPVALCAGDMARYTPPCFSDPSHTVRTGPVTTDSIRPNPTAPPMPLQNATDSLKTK